MSAPVAPASRRPPFSPVERRHHADLLTAHDLTVSIGGKAVVTGLNLALQPGERLVLLGRNGVGKTTLLHTLAGLRAADAGEIDLAGQTYKAHGPRGAARLRGLLPQHQGDAFAASVLETVLIGRHPHLSRWDWESAADERIARDALAAVGLADLAAAGPSQGSQGAPSGGSERSERGGRSLAARSIHTLSGGERQRVALATLLAQQPALYLLDEPLAHLDLNHQIAALEEMTRRVRDEPAALVMVLHDINLAARYSDRALLLHGAGEYELGASQTLLDAPRLTRLYGHPLRVIEADGRRWFVPET